MVIAGYQLFRYALPFQGSPGQGGRAIRNGLLLCLRSTGGATGWGEAAPLPGFSRENLDQAAAALRAGADRLIGTAWPASPATMRATMAERLPHAVPPSVRFALEQALGEAWAGEHGRSLAHLWREDPAETLALAALVMPDEGGEAGWAGYRAVKVKVGRGTPGEDAARVRQVWERLGGQVGLRLDANRAWDLDDALAFAAALEVGSGVLAVEFIEEPLRDVACLEAFVAGTGLPVALDETLSTLAPEALGRYRKVRALVLKPTLLGGFTAVARWVEAGRRLGMRPVISAAFESGIGMRGLVAAAAALGEAGVPAGLDTYRRLRGDVLTPRPALAGPEVAVAPVLTGTFGLNHRCLTLLHTAGA